MVRSWSEAAIAKPEQDGDGVVSDIDDREIRNAVAVQICNGDAVRDQACREIRLGAEASCPGSEENGSSVGSRVGGNQVRLSFTVDVHNGHRGRERTGRKRDRRLERWSRLRRQCHDGDKENRGGKSAWERGQQQ